ncbi:MAG TPA: farnesyl diphosphate synthase [Hyphomicrobiales bacterium]|nr:farnesyl diphosphate synthase [Hyphomicrobiales bacterium]
MPTLHVLTDREYALWAAQCRQRVESMLRRGLRLPNAPAPLGEAMRYAVLGGGKRIRPLLSYAGAMAAGGHEAAADVPAAAVELIHAYSLVHDDLPAMDDDRLRRGRPTCHIAFGEAQAILAGDALQALAFELLAASPELAVGHATRLRMMQVLAQAAGATGMVAGQALDIAATGQPRGEAALNHMHSLKTGALIRASVLLGALSSNVAGAAQLQALDRFAQLAGLAFQIQDDILDVTALTAVSGKQQGKDAILNKPTYVSLLGLDGARDRLHETAAAARAALRDAGAGVGPLLWLLEEIVRREA